MQRRSGKQGLACYSCHGLSPLMARFCAALDQLWQIAGMFATWKSQRGNPTIDSLALRPRPLNLDGKGTTWH